MDRLANWTGGVNVTTTATTAPFPGQNCVSTTSFLDKQLVTAPSLPSVSQELRWTFLLHAYGFACLFFVLGFYTFLSILHLRSLISSRPFMSTINVFLCLLGGSRAVSLFIDPYSLKEIMPKIIGSIIWDVGFPCLTSAFCLIQLAFIQLTQLKFGPEKMQKESCLSLVITGHFFFIIASNIALICHNCYMAKYVVQIVFLVWSIVLYTMFLHAGYKIMHLLRTMPSSMLTRDSINSHQKGIMQLAILAPYSNLASSVAAALVPTLLNPKIKEAEEAETEADSKDPNEPSKADRTPRSSRKERDAEREPRASLPTVSTVPEVYVRPPTPTPTINLPIITVSSPSRRSSVASRRGSESSRNSRRNSECSVRFVNEDEVCSTPDRRRTNDFSPRHSPDRMSRRHSENVTPLGSSRDLRRCSDFSHEKNRSSQFATKLRRNSDFGNRTPRRMLPTIEHHRLPRVLDISPTGSRRNSDVSGIASPRAESRRNSEISYRRNSEQVHVIKPLPINRRSSDISIRTLDKSPTHYQSTAVPEKPEIPEKSESDSDQQDCSEKASLMAERTRKRDSQDEGRARKKNLSWKNEKEKEDAEGITAETILLPGSSAADGRVTGTDFTLHSILNHIAYVNRSKIDTPLQIQEANTAAVRRSQIGRVLNVTYATAILGIVLCVADIARIFGPYGLLADSVKFGTRPNAGQYPRAWPWLIYQTICRALELIMGCAMASITKQPSVSPRHQYLSSYPNYVM